MNKIVEILIVAFALSVLPVHAQEFQAQGQPQSNEPTVPITLPDFVCDGASHVVGPLVPTVKWIQFVSPGGSGGNTGLVRIGDTKTSATQGLQLPPGSSFYLGKDTMLGAWWYWCPTGNVVNVLYGQ